MKKFVQSDFSLYFCKPKCGIMGFEMQNKYKIINIK